jgi:hypothetical protein
MAHRGLDWRRRQARRLAWPVVASHAAGYSAFLFGQAEGRDFWQSPAVLPHLVFAALVAGTATLLLVALPQADAAGAAHTLRNLLLGSLAVLLPSTDLGVGAHNRISSSAISTPMRRPRWDRKVTFGRSTRVRSSSMPFWSP